MTTPGLHRARLKDSFRHACVRPRVLPAKGAAQPTASFAPALISTGKAEQKQICPFSSFPPAPAPLTGSSLAPAATAARAPPPRLPGPAHAPRPRRVCLGRGGREGNWPLPRAGIPQDILCYAPGRAVGALCCFPSRVSHGISCAIPQGEPSGRSAAAEAPGPRHFSHRDRREGVAKCETCKLFLRRDVL